MSPPSAHSNRQLLPSGALRPLKLAPADPRVRLVPTTAQAMQSILNLAVYCLPETSILRTVAYALSALVGTMTLVVLFRYRYVFAAHPSYGQSSAQEKKDADQEPLFVTRVERFPDFKWSVFLQLMFTSIPYGILFKLNR
ncbi:hypothetical protein OC846_004029 [Tilletia horrida]|uniref:Uncharacterized protein n=1 Tax=Tilletia horrida TaxID=155126 RepID=A0AAN6GPG0_9BASI|nr:hypothetical protein OC845_006553 [Tilletia horrida]KAK0549566.1 hypothetical protein OC846_004029 [Tilletia horrida]KAK0567171.1 hypothetical protein OC861_002857 [Tilletia horrida]